MYKVYGILCTGTQCIVHTYVTTHYNGSYSNIILFVLKLRTHAQTYTKRIIHVKCEKKEDIRVLYKYITRK